MIYYFYMSISKTLNSLILKYPKNIFFLQHDRHACHYIVCKRQQGHEYEIKVQIRVIPTPEEKNGHAKRTMTNRVERNYAKIKAVINFARYNQPLLSVDELKSLFFFRDKTRK